MTQEPDRTLLTIGGFAQSTRLTAKALRLYDEIGLLRPAAVDPSSGRRQYGAGHRHLVALEVRHSGRRILVRHIHAIFREDEYLMFGIQTRHVPAQRVMSIQRRLRAPETDAFAEEAKAAFARHLGGRPPAGPFTLIFHGTVDDESDGPLEAVLPSPGGVQATDLIGIRTEPAHDEAFTTITRAQWAYPAILAAYDAVSCSPEVSSRPGSRLSCREVYLADPGAIGDGDPVCDIAFPLGPEG